MNRSFTLEGSKNEFIKSYLKSLTPFALGISALLFQLLSSKFTYKFEAAAGIALALLVVAALIGAAQYRKYSNLRFLISERSIQVFDRNKGRVETLLFSELEDVKLPGEKDSKKKGRAAITLTFSSGRKLVFSNMLPYFPEMLDWVQHSLFSDSVTRAYTAELRTKTK